MADEIKALQATVELLIKEVDALKAAANKTEAAPAPAPKFNVPDKAITVEVPGEDGKPYKLSVKFAIASFQHKGKLVVAEEAIVNKELVAELVAASMKKGKLLPGMFVESSSK